MKYEKPKIKFVKTQMDSSVSAICWAYATGHLGSSFYYDSSGPGYVELVVSETTGGCNGAIIQVVGYHNGATVEDGQEALERIPIFGGGNRAEPYKNSPFEKKPSSSWS